MQFKLHITNSITGEEFDFELTQNEIAIGRSRGDNALVLTGDKVSRRHAVLKQEGNTYVLTDLESVNGTLVNGEAISKRVLADGDTISIGPYSMVLREPPPPVVRYETRGLGETVVLRSSEHVI